MARVTGSMALAYRDHNSILRKARDEWVPAIEQISKEMVSAADEDMEQ